MMETILENRVENRTESIIREGVKNKIPIFGDRKDVYQMLKELPENTSVFKCYTCRNIFDIFSQGISVLVALSDKEHILCPDCKSESTELICKVDAYSMILKMKGYKCREGILMSGTEICPVCKTPICPQCFNHSVVSLSRVTGYIQDISGWNMAKRQELLDRKRYSIEKSFGSLA